MAIDNVVRLPTCQPAYTPLPLALVVEKMFSNLSELLSLTSVTFDLRVQAGVKF